jgi:glucan 1,3-beta-glucosidase
MIGSQNGFDNSGQLKGLEWTSVTFLGATTFMHWPIRTAEWAGSFDPLTLTYTSTNHSNINHALEVIQTIAETYKTSPAILGLEPINEPWQFTPIDLLKQFYWDGYHIVKAAAPTW